MIIVKQPLAGRHLHVGMHRSRADAADRNRAGASPLPSAMCGTSARKVCKWTEGGDGEWSEQSAIVEEMVEVLIGSRAPGGCRPLILVMPCGESVPKAGSTST